TKTLADFDLAVVHENFEDGGQAEHTPKSRHEVMYRLVNQQKPMEIAKESEAQHSIETSYESYGERATKTRQQIKSDSVKALPEIESDENKALPESEPNPKKGWFDFTNTKESKIQNVNNPKTLLEDENRVAI
ncbi:hypothetical protein HID58_088877, partial [Brassica napus]